MHVRVLIVAVVLGSGCSLEERDDFLLYRRCAPAETPAEGGCDPHQVCLPHAVLASGFGEFRCRDRDSFEFFADAPEPPLAYCSDELPCPDEVVCAPDRVREGVAVRRRVCQLPSAED